MKVAFFAVLLVAASSVSAEPLPERSCQAVEQIRDLNCEGFLICRRASDNPDCELIDSGNPDYVMCFYPCRSGKSYDYEKKKCSRNHEC